MYNKSAEEIYDLLERGEITEEMIIKEVASDVVYKILRKRISHCLENNDMYGAITVNKSKLFGALTDEQKKEISDIRIMAHSEISRRLLDGEVTPMMLDDENKFSGYLRYHLYLTRQLCKENPPKAKEMAKEVYNVILADENFLSGKESLLKQYQELF